jgi:hypothetical protein
MLSKRIMMDFKHRLFSILLLFILLFVSACASPSWSPIKWGSTPQEKARAKALGDAEVVFIDKEEYVKIYNSVPSGEGSQSKYIYVPVKEYLANKEKYASNAYRKEEAKKGPSSPASSSLSTPAAGEPIAVASPKSPSPALKKKVVVAHFDDRTTFQGDEMLGDWIAERLIKEVDRRSSRVVFVDYRMVREFLDQRGISQADLEKQNVLRLLNEVFGIQALVIGHLAGPYTFLTTGSKDLEETASAVLRIEAKVIDTLTGKSIKNLEVSNPILAAKMKGSFSEEKAKVKAIDVTISNLIGPLSRELDGMDWFCRIAKVDGEQVYLNAGKLTGIKVGDILEVFRPGTAGEQGELIGKIRISTFFGIDASVGNLIQGKGPEVDDILRLAKQGST